MSPFQIIVITVFAVLAVVGLIFFSTFKGNGGAEKVGSVTVWGTLPQSVVNNALGELQRTHHEFDKVIYLERPAATFDEDLADAIASGTGPDLILINQEQLLTERNRLSVIPSSSIPERTFRDTYAPINELYLTTGGTYAIPFLVDPMVLYYNRGMLSTAGAIEAPKTWEAVVGLAPALIKKSDAGVIAKSAIAFGAYENIPNARAILSLLFLQSGSSVSLRSAQGIRSNLLAPNQSDRNAPFPAQSALAFYTQFADPAKSVYSWNRSIADARTSFIAGDTAMYVGFASEQPLLSASNPNLDYDMTAVPQPQTASRSVDYARAYAFAIPKASHNAKGALQFAMSFSDKSSSILAAQALSMAPAARAGLAANPSDRFTPVIYPLVLISQGWLSPSPHATDVIFAAMINRILSGQQSVYESLVTADQALNAAL